MLPRRSFGKAQPAQFRGRSSCGVTPDILTHLDHPVGLSRSFDEVLSQTAILLQDEPLFALNLERRALPPFKGHLVGRSDPGATVLGLGTDCRHRVGPAHSSY